MTVNTNFQHIQQLLIDSSAQGQQRREHIYQAAGIAKITSVALMSLSGLLLAMSVVGVVAHPIIAGIGLGLATVLAVTSYDAFRISQNVKQIVDDSLSNIPTRIVTSLSQNQLVVALFKNTLVADVLCREPAITYLKSPA